MIGNYFINAAFSNLKGEAFRQTLTFLCDTDLGAIERVNRIKKNLIVPEGYGIDSIILTDRDRNKIHIWDKNELEQSFERIPLIPIPIGDNEQKPLTFRRSVIV